VINEGKKVRFILHSSWFHLQGFPLHPPRDLNSLLTEIESSEDVKKSVWLKKFREHLTKLERFDLEAALGKSRLYSVFRQFRQAKFADGGSILSLSKFFLLHQ
jgi:hypothetical protein